MQTSKTVHTRSKRREFNNIRHITRSRSQSHSSSSSMNSGNALNNNNSSTVLDSWCMAALCMSVVLLIWFASCSFYTAGCVLLFEATKSERRRNDLYSVCCIFFLCWAVVRAHYQKYNLVFGGNSMVRHSLRSASLPAFFSSSGVFY